MPPYHEALTRGITGPATSATEKVKMRCVANIGAFIWRVNPILLQHPSHTASARWNVFSHHQYLSGRIYNTSRTIDHSFSVEGLLFSFSLSFTDIFQISNCKCSFFTRPYFDFLTPKISCVRNLRTRETNFNFLCP